MRSGLTRGRCTSCGGTETVDAIDNHGKPYKGCANCRIMSLDEINAILRAGGEDEIVTTDEKPATEGEKR